MRDRARSWILLLLACSALTSMAALPSRLVLLLDGVSYRDMKALQEGTSCKDSKGQEVKRQAFQQGYFPVSRLVSTFPSISDPAWTEILGNRPTPGYQRTYFDAGHGTQVSLNGLTSLVEYEKQMTGPMESNFRRVMSYVWPLKAFKDEVSALAENFLNSNGDVTNYYALIHSTDVAQHLSGDIRAMLCVLDQKLQELRKVYKQREGKDLEILILSDHGNNHAGFGKRVAIETFLEKAGYRISTSLRNGKDIVLPTAGIESWVEIHNAPAETERLVSLLSHLTGVDVVTAQAPGQTNRFIVVNANGERASIDWNTAKNSFRYSTETGDPLDYQPVIESLARKEALDVDGFAAADKWMTETFSHRYPLALERIALGHTRVVRNPASILVSLQNDYVHCGFVIRRGIILVGSGGTHGGLNDIDSTGVLLSSFAPTHDTSSGRVGEQFGRFTGLRDYRAQESGAKWVSDPSSKRFLLQLWTPAFVGRDLETPIDVTIEKCRPPLLAQIPRMGGQLITSGQWELTFNRPVSSADKGGFERTYVLPPQVIFRPRTIYRISGRLRDEKRTFHFTFQTDDRGLPLEPYL